MGYYRGMTAEQMEAQRRATEKRQQENRQETHDEVINENTSKVADYKSANENARFETEFMQHDLKTIKGMVEDGTRVDEVEGIADAWDQVRDQLVGGKGDNGGGAHGDLERAVRGVLQHWEGDTADRFKGQADNLLRQIKNSATHCETVSEVLRGAARDYRDIHDKVSKIEEPGWFDNTMDFLGDLGERDDKITEEAIRNRDIPKDLLAKADEGFIGAEKEAKLQAANHMETLARRYVTYADRMDTSKKVDPDPGDTVPPSDPGVPMPGPIPVSSGSASKPGTGGTTGQQLKGSTGGSKAPLAAGPGDAGVTGGVPSAQTKVDSMPAGITGTGADDAAGGGGLRGSGAGGGAGTAGGAGSAGPGAGGGLLGGGGAAGGASRGAGGRAGMGGGAGNGAGRGGATATGRGALARAKGGMVGAPKGISGGTPATQGGTGLGKGRGGAPGGGRGMGGMLGGTRGSSQRPDSDEEKGQRPDYLVEDEETWAPEDNRSVPKTIE